MMTSFIITLSFCKAPSSGEGLSRFSPLLTPRLLMSAGPRATLSLKQFCLPQRSRKTLQRPEHLHLLAERRYKNPRLFGPGICVNETFLTLIFFQPKVKEQG